MHHEPYKVKLCKSCRWTPENLTEECGEGHYDPNADDFCCPDCPETPIYRPAGVTFPRERDRRY